MQKNSKKNAVKFFPLLENADGVTALLTTRHYGFSQDPYNSLNFSSIVGDDEKNVKQNYDVLAGYLDCCAEDIFSMEQIHSSNVFILNENSKKLLTRNRIKKTDAVITNLRQTAILAMGADCPQIALYDSKQKVIAVIHAGWKGLINNIIEKTLTAMNSDPKNILVHTGAHLCQNCFEVKKEVSDIFSDNFENSDKIIHKDKDGKITISLQNAIHTKLTATGIQQKNIRSLNMCTACENSLFFSYRKENKTTGRTALAVMLR